MKKSGAASRKLWSKPDPNLNPASQPKPPAKEEVPQGYGEYLLLLQERNRLLKKFRQKDQKQIDIERKEQGFALYVNGANADVLPPGDAPGSRSAVSKTAENPRINRIGYQELQELEEEYRRKQSQTAPSKVPRKNWLASSINIKTSDGEKVKLQVPGSLTGNYEDDFEPCASESFQHLSNQSGSSEELNSSDSDMDSERELGDGRAASRPVEEDEEEYESPKQQLMLSIDDVRTLRRSLVMNASIRQSIAEEVDTDEDPESDREDTIPEEDGEDVPDEAVTARDSLEVPTPRAGLNPGEMIVLEFGPSPSKIKEEVCLGAVRKQDTDSLGLLRHSRPTLSTSGQYYPAKLPCDRKSVKTPRDVVLAAEVSSDKMVRPLSASRKSHTQQLDNTADAAAVL